MPTEGTAFISVKQIDRPRAIRVAKTLHEMGFSLVATIFFGLLLLGRRLWGWRGRLAIRLTLGGFILLLLSYVGSRFVLEVILNRI